MLRQRCPRCGKGKIFTGILKMNDPCPVCGLIFQREEGYFLGAMYFSYLLGAMFLGAAYLLALILLPDWNWYLLLAIVLVPYVLLTPVFFRYSRTIWIYYERWSCPSDASAGAYEKARAKEFAERNPTHSPK